MGFLRLYLALCVVNAHTGNLFPWLVPRGRHAVELFFIISGFYMAMVLSGRYSKISDFYESRWLRIAIPYYFHLVIIVLASVAAGIVFSQWLALEAFAADPLAVNGLAGIVAATATNLTIIGQDAVLYFRDNAGEGFRFTAAFGSHADPLYRFLVMPQCWSVSIELIFYAIVPFLNRFNSLWLGVVFLISAGARFFAYGPMGLDNDPWVYRFFPFELAWFLAGMLGWRLLAALEKVIGRRGSPGWPTYLGICVAMVGGGWVFRWSYEALGPRHGYSGVAFVLLCASVPFILAAFHLTRSHHMDRLIGELSYPVYRNHLFFIVAVRAIPGLEPFAAWHGLVVGGLSVLAAWLFWHYFLRAFEARRHRTFGLAPLPT